MKDLRGFVRKCPLSVRSFMSYYESLEDKNVDRGLGNGVQTHEVSGGSLKTLLELLVISVKIL